MAYFEFETIPLQSETMESNEFEMRGQRPMRTHSYPARKPVWRDNRRPRAIGRRLRAGLGTPFFDPDFIDANSSGSTQPATEYARWAQSALNDAVDARLQINGVFDGKTRAAIRAFQSQNGIAADGYVGPDTERALIDRRSQSASPVDVQEEWELSHEHSGSCGCARCKGSSW